MELADYSFEIKDVKNKWKIVGDIFIYITEGTKKYRHNNCICFLNLIC